jgi:hypothetical protein
MMQPTVQKGVTVSKKRITVSLGNTEYEQLCEAAKKEERSLSWMVAKAVRTYLDAAEQGQQVLPYPSSNASAEMRNA